MIKALIDTNVIIDVGRNRLPFYHDSAEIFRLIDENVLHGFVSSSIITDIFYLLQKDEGKEKALNFLKALVEVVDVLSVDKDTINAALASGWTDFEDAVQTQVAIENDMDVIITRNVKDFQHIKFVKTVTPHDFIKNPHI